MSLKCAAVELQAYDRQTDGQTDRQTDRRTNSSIAICPLL